MVGCTYIQKGRNMDSFKALTVKPKQQIPLGKPWSRWK